MKKLFSVLLAVVMMASFVVTASAAEKVSLLPSSADKFELQSGGDGNVTVTAEGNGYKFVADKGWPCAIWAAASEGQEPWIQCNIADDLYLTYDFEVKSGAASIVVYFCGQNPKDQAAIGNYCSINALIDPANMDAFGTITDLPAGTYKGSVKIDSIGYGEHLLGENGEMIISGSKVFAVGGEVVVNELSVGPADDDDTVVTTKATDAPVATTTKAGTKPTTDSAKTGDTTNAMLFIVIAAVAASVVTLSVVASKKAKSR